MIDELKNKEIFEKIGGAFKVTALIQKRMVELLEGSRPLIENTEGKTMMEIVIEEVMQNKITPDYTQDSEKIDIPKL
jgi:DNA-directed RNA polymerase subunit omega